MILDKYLWEELSFTQEGMVSAYVKPGPKAQRIKTDKILINIETKSLNKKNEQAKTDNEPDDVLKTLEEECFSALKSTIGHHFPDLKSVYLAIPIECYREIAEKLPQNKEEMLEVDQMTDFRYSDRFTIL